MGQERKNVYFDNGLNHYSSSSPSFHHATQSSATTTASLSWIQDALSPWLIILRHVSLGWALRHWTSGAHVSATLWLWSEHILRPSPSHFHHLALTCSLIVFMPNLLLNNHYCLSSASKLSGFSSSICVGNHYFYLSIKVNHSYERIIFGFNQPPDLIKICNFVVSTVGLMFQIF